MDRAKIGAATAAVIAVMVTLGSGTPARLPNVALSSTVLFHLERVVGLVTTYVFLLVLLSRAWNGQLPSEVGTQGIKYSDAGLAGLEAEAARARDERAGMLRRIEAIEREAYRGKGE